MHTFCLVLMLMTRQVVSADHGFSGTYAASESHCNPAQVMIVVSLTNRRTCLPPIFLYYNRRDPYFCSAKAPVLEGSGSRRMYPLKGTSVDRVYVVFGARVDLGFFTIRQKRIRGGGAFAEGNSAT